MAHRPAPQPPDPYRALGVPRDASPARIAAAYRALVLALHPDTRSAPTDPARLAEVLAAYALLRDPERRAAHDRRHTAPPSPDPVAAAPGPVPIPVRVRRGGQAGQPDIRVGPVRHHPS
ncbi:J domain-containing protein [Saccharothrix australiensis]|uniref:J domain-containing protein n=1 Tax=Saccharothrix australiensis TaxID=2072 RepID=UPI000EAEBECC|nr:J domain-containing protein [Saccharothrix australiensis]